VLSGNAPKSIHEIEQMSKKCYPRTETEKMSDKQYVLLFFLTACFILLACSCEEQDVSEEKYRLYQQQLSEFRQEFQVADMPRVRFFLFGMGNREKMLYKDGSLMNAFTGEVLYNWQIREDIIIPNDYRVEILTVSGEKVSVFENEKGVYIKAGRKTSLIPLTDNPVVLPDFKGHRYSEILKVLHQELLINILNSRPLPNFFVYQNPWRRDGAMMAMCLEKTGNINLIRDWVLSLKTSVSHTWHAAEVFLYLLEE
jgi:hypothetical protein